MPREWISEPLLHEKGCAAARTDECAGYGERSGDDEETRQYPIGRIYGHTEPVFHARKQQTKGQPTEKSY